jgi:hypothetical protein
MIFQEEVFMMVLFHVFNQVWEEETWACINIGWMAFIKMLNVE